MEGIRHPEPPAQAGTTVVLYLPGTMRSIYDQSVDLLTDRLARACSHVTGRRFMAERDAASLVLTPGRELRLRTIASADPIDRKVVLVEADYGPILTASFEERGVIISFVRLLALLCRMAWTVFRLLGLRSRPPHTPLSRAQKGLVALAYVLGVVVVVSIGVTAFEVVAALVAVVSQGWTATEAPGGITGGTMELFPLLLEHPWLNSAMEGLSVALAACSVIGAVIAVAWCLVPSSIPDSCIAVGKEYSGLVRYILYGEKEEEIEAYVSAVSGCIAERYPGADVHLVCFSFGCVVGFNQLFPKQAGEPKFSTPLRSVTFMGFPYVIIEAAFPGYLGNRLRLEPAGFPWKNVFIENDVLGSRLENHLPAIFAAPPWPDLDDVLVKPQKESRLNFVADHMAYWDPNVAACSEAFIEVARSIGVERAGA